MSEDKLENFDWITDLPAGLEREPEGQKEAERLKALVDRIQRRSMKRGNQQQFAELKSGLHAMKLAIRVIGKIFGDEPDKPSPRDHKAFATWMLNDADVLELALLQAKNSPDYNGESDDEIKQNLIDKMQLRNGDPVKIAPPLEAEPDNTPATIPPKTKRIARSQTDQVPFLATAEVQAATLLTANYSDQDNFTFDHDAMQVRWSYKTCEAALDVIAPGAWDTLPIVQDVDKESALREQYNQFSLVTRDDSLVAIYVLDRLIEGETPVTEISFTELLQFESKSHLAPKEREKRAREYDRLFRMWSAWKPFRKGLYKGQAIVRPSPLLVYEGPFYKDGQSPFSGIGVYSTPLGFTFTDSSWATEKKANPTLTNPIGDLRKVAGIPTGKVSGDWAQSIALAALSLGRINASRTGGVLRVSREVLLTMYKPNTSVESILSGNTPKRARENWEVAKWILKEQKICTIVDPPTEWPRQGWGDPWLNETVEITLAGEALEQAQHIQLQKAKHKDKKPPKPSKPKG